MNSRWYGLAVLLLSAVVWLSLPLAGCSSECTPGLGTECCQDNDCTGNVSCGPNYICSRRCFSGEKGGCATGYQCNATGTGCVAAEVSSQESTKDSKVSDAGTKETTQDTTSRD